MSTVNQNVYPIQETPSGYTGLWTRTNVNVGNGLPFNEGWDDSIAVSQSRSVNAPFNSIDYIFGQTPDAVYKTSFRKNMQKIALYGVGTWPTAGNNIYTNSGLQSTGDFWHLAAKRRKGGNDADTGNLSAYSSDVSGTWADLRSAWSPNNLWLVTGLNPQKILGTIYVGFVSNTGNRSYCSLKDWETNYSSTLPNFAFMVVYIQRVLNVGSHHIVVPIDMQPRNYNLWKKYADINAGTPYNFGEFIDWLPPCQTFGVNRHNSGLTSYECYSPITNTLVFPLCCMANLSMAKRNFSAGLFEYHGVPVFGAADYMYNIIWKGDYFTTELTDEAIRLLPNVAATYGLPFTDDYIVNSYNLYAGNKTTYIPYPNSDGYFQGAYETLTVNGTLSPDLSDGNAAIWVSGTEGMWDDRSYTPPTPEPTEEIDLTEPTLTPVGSFNKTYILNKSEVDSIQDYIYGADDTTLENFLKGISNFGGSPMDAFISLHMWPFDVRTFVTASQTAPVVVGRTKITLSPQGDVIGYLMPEDAKAVVNCGTYKIEPLFESFLDYEPYTTINLYIPFIGSVDLPPSLYMDKTVNVKLICDWITGAATAVIYADGIPLIYQQGVGAVSISMTGDNHSRTAGDVIGGLIGAAGSAAGAVASAYTGNWAHAAKLGFNAAEQLSNTRNEYGKTEFTQAGSSSPMCGLYMPMSCYITISRPKLLYSAADLAEYAHGVGYADSRVTTLAAEAAAGSGIVVGSPVRVSFTGSVYPTPGELNEILELLSSGVFPA